jgi:hypothetical protein
MCLHICALLLSLSATLHRALCLYLVVQMDKLVHETPVCTFVLFSSLTTTLDLSVCLWLVVQMDKLVHETPDGACVCTFVVFFSHSVPHCTLLCACAMCNVQMDKLVHETPDAAAHAPTADDLTLFTTTMLDSFYNFATSFATSRADAVRMCHHHHAPPPPSPPLLLVLYHHCCCCCC